jgi:hypothetical protein
MSHVTGEAPAPPRGPGEFFRDHRGVYALCMASALGAARYAVVEARKADPGRALGWWVLAGLTGTHAIGIAVSHRRARRAATGSS